MFMGEYNHTVDPKGRLIVPSKFREQLGSFRADYVYSAVYLLHHTGGLLYRKV